MKAYGLIMVAACLAAPASAKVLGIGKDNAVARIINQQGLPIGTAKVTESKKHGLRVEIQVKGLQRGERGIHLHAIGSCEGPRFTSAGPHWNPHGKMHGLSNPEGSHAGDMPNLLVNRNGRGKLKFDIPEGQFDRGGGLMDDDGASIVIHAMSDDQRTDPSGNSGDRIACGVFVRK